MFGPDGPSFVELVRQALSSTQQGYDQLAPKFDATPFRTPDAVLERVAERVDQLGAPDRALDVCCGTGAAMAALRPICRESITGLDFSQGMLDEAQRRSVLWKGSCDVRFVKGDALWLPFQNELDLVTCFGAFGHIPRHRESELCRGIHRALRAGGRFVFVTAHAPRWWSREHVVSRMFNGAMRVRNVLHRPQFVMYYLTFLLPEAKRLLVDAGFQVRVEPGVFEPPYERLELVIAEKRATL